MTNKNEAEKRQPQQEASEEPFVRAVSELLGHISDVLPDEAFDFIDTGKWNAVSGWIGASRAAATAPAGGLHQAWAEGYAAANKDSKALDAAHSYAVQNDVMQYKTPPATTNPYPATEPAGGVTDQQIIEACASVGLGPSLGLKAGRAVLATAARAAEPEGWEHCEPPNFDNPDFTNWRNLPSDGKYVYHRDPSNISQWVRHPVPPTGTSQGEGTS